MSKQMRVSPEQARQMFGKGKTPAEKSAANQLVKSEASRWVELSELRVEVSKLKAAFDKTNTAVLQLIEVVENMQRSMKPDGQ